MQHCWFPGVALFMAHVMSVNVAVNPACECVVYQSYGKTQGQFHSPNFPAYYSRNIDCILFTFIADVDEIIEITFFQFDLKWRGVYTGCGDYLRLYVNLDRAEINEHNVYDFELCGNISHIDQKTYYSKGRSLVMEFHSDASHVNHTGFQGVFKFLDGRSFITNGRKPVGTQCTYIYQSRNNQSRGSFFSPLYPQNYPRHANCQYIFYGNEREKVKVKFSNIQLYNSDISCKVGEDIIMVYDGKDHNAPLVHKYCDSQNDVEFISSGPYLYITFQSNDQNQRKGFAASYTFLPEHFSTTPITTVEICNQHIRSTSKKEGIIESQFYPDGPYQSSIKCIYEFEGSENERIQIVFLGMNLIYTGGNRYDPYDCAGQDSLTIILRLKNKEGAPVEKKTWTYCGSKMPQSLMSNSPWMKIEFNTESSQQKSGAGFQFKFMIRKDFGITTGKQDPSGACRFTYTSTSNKLLYGNFTSPNYPGLYPRSMTCEYIFKGQDNEVVEIRFSKFDLPPHYTDSYNLKSGNFTSPNYGGYYPRNTVCQYIFHGHTEEHVVIGFSQFNVDGIPPSCGEHQDSDYVEFSNFDEAEDRKMKKRCGHEIPPETKSDGAFFRVTFKSDDSYDGTGFLGHYRFIEESSSSTATAPQGSNPSSAARASSRLSLVITIGLGLINIIIMHCKL